MRSSSIMAARDRDYFRSVLCIAFVTLLHVRVGAGTFYVNLSNTAPVAPYSSWSTAATNIQDAIDVASAGDEVVVTNGIYATGGRSGNRVTVDKSLTLRSVSGPLFTVIQGYQMTGITN